jgi:hypothetical protein
LPDHMAHYKIPGVSIAVFDNYEIEWAKGYGVLDTRPRRPLTRKQSFKPRPSASPWPCRRRCTSSRQGNSRSTPTAAKQFALTERFHADLRGELYNLLNHANFNIPGATLGAADFRVVLSARAARTVQLGLRVSF